MTPDTSIYEAELSTRTIEALREANVKTLGDMTKIIVDQGSLGLLRIPNLGVMSLRDCLEVLAKMQTPPILPDSHHAALVALWQIANPAGVQSREDLIDIARVFFDTNDTPS